MAINVSTGQPISGSQVYYFIQSIDAPIGSNAYLPAYRTDGGTTLGGDFLDEQSQQGRVLRKGADEHEIELTTYFVPADESNKIITDAQKNGKSVKVWEVTVDESVVEGEGDDTTYPAKFGYGKVSEYELSAGIGDLAEVSYTLGIVGSLQDGRFPLTEEDITVLENVYGYQNPGETTGDYDNITSDSDSSGSGEPGSAASGEE